MFSLIFKFSMLEFDDSSAAFQDKMLLAIIVGNLDWQLGAHMNIIAGHVNNCSPAWGSMMVHIYHLHCPLPSGRMSQIVRLHNFHTTKHGSYCTRTPVHIFWLGLIVHTIWDMRYLGNWEYHVAPNKVKKYLSHLWYCLMMKSSGEVFGYRLLN